MCVRLCVREHVCVSVCVRVFGRDCVSECVTVSVYECTRMSECLDFGQEDSGECRSFSSDAACSGFWLLRREVTLGVSPTPGRR